MTLFLLKSSCSISLNPPNNRSSLSYTDNYWKNDQHQQFSYKKINYGDALELVGKQASHPLLDELLDVCRENATACKKTVSSLPIQCDLALVRESSLRYLQWGNLPKEKLNINPCGRDNFLRKVIDAGDIMEHHVLILSHCHADLSDESSLFLPVDALPSTFRIPSRKNSCKTIRRRRANGNNSESICRIEDLEERVVSFDFNKAAEALRKHAIGYQEHFGLASSGILICIVAPLLLALIAWKNWKTSLGNKVTADSSPRDILTARDRTKRRRAGERSEEIGEWKYSKKKRNINMDDSALSYTEMPMGDVSNLAASTISVVGRNDDGTLAKYNDTHHVPELPKTDTHISDYILSSTEISTEHGSTTHAIVDQYQQRWESKGLNRQASLERASTFEMHLCLFHLCKHFVSSMYFESHLQTERHHRETMDSPLLEKIRRHQNQIFFLPFNSTLLVLAIASKHSWLLTQQSLIKGVHDYLFSTICPSCKIPNIEAYQEVFTSFCALRLGSAITLMYNGVQSANMFWCVGKIVFLAFVIGAFLYLGFHQTIPQKIILIILGLITWRSIIQLSIIVMIVNIIIALLVGWVSDATGMRLYLTDREIHYERWVLVGKVLLWCSSAGVGCWFGL